MIASNERAGLPSVSIIINTIDRVDSLSRLLNSCRQLTHPDFEVIVVNGPSTDDTAALLDAFDGEIKALTCPRPNLSESRNIGLRAAAGEIVVFIDDDALPADRDWLDSLIEPFFDPGVGAVGGPVLRGDLEDSFEFREGKVSDYAQHQFDRDDPAIPTRAERLIPSVRGCNVAFRAAALAEVGGFDERFSYYVEEADVCQRLVKVGYRIENAPAARVRHYSATSARRRGPNRMSWYEITRSDTYYCLKNGQDRLPVRIWKTLRLAPKKHFVRQLVLARRSRQIRHRDWLWFLLRWIAGLAVGLWRGISSRRRLGYSAPTPDAQRLTGFPTSSSSASLVIGILSQDLPPGSVGGGIGRFSLALARGLQERGHEVHVITRSGAPVRYERLGLAVHGIQPGMTASEWTEALPNLSRCLIHSVAALERIREKEDSVTDFDIVLFPNGTSRGLGRSGRVRTQSSYRV